MGTVVTCGCGERFEVPGGGAGGPGTCPGCGETVGAGSVAGPGEGDGRPGSPPVDVDSWWRSLVADRPPLRWLYAHDLDGRVFGANNGYGPFTTLATFALGQGAALATMAKAQYESLALALYALASLLTVLWINAMLRATEGSEGRLRAFDRPSIRYGRWVMSWTLLLVVVLALMANLRLLPFQTRRAPVDAAMVFHADAQKLSLRAPQEKAGGTAYDRDKKYMDAWLTWMTGSEHLGAAKQLYWIEQTGTFGQDFQTYTAELKPRSTEITIMQPVAFLVRRGSDAYRPVYRQIPLALTGDGESDRLIIEEPNRDEFLVVIAYLRRADGKLFDAKEPIEVSIVRSK